MRFKIKNGVLVRFSDELAENVTVPSRVQKIGSSAFEQCQGLRQITLPSHLTEIGEYAFSECRHLKYVTFSGSKKAKNPLVIKDRAFSGCALLEEITLPEEVTAIGSFAFSDCTSLRRLAPASFHEEGAYLPEGFTSLGVHAFEDCGLPSVHLPSTIQSCGKQVLRGCSALKEVTIRIPDGTEYRFSVSEPDNILDVLLFQDYETALRSPAILGEMLRNGYCRPDVIAFLTEHGEGLLRDVQTLLKLIRGEALAEFLQCEELRPLWTQDDIQNTLLMMTRDSACREALRQAASLEQILHCDIFPELCEPNQLEKLIIHLMGAEKDNEIVPRVDFSAIFRSKGTPKIPKLGPRNARKLIDLLEKSGIPALLSDAFLEKLAVLANDNKEYELQLFWLSYRKNSGSEDRLSIIDRFDL